MGKWAYLTGPKDSGASVKGMPRGWSYERLASDPGSADSLDDFPDAIRQHRASPSHAGVDHPPIRPCRGEWDSIVEQAAIPDHGRRYGPDPSFARFQKGVVTLGNRVFSLSHREVYKLFKAWGWEDGPERGDGHKRMRWPATDQYVQIMPPDRTGTGESGNAIAMKQAWKIMGLASLAEFFEKVDEIRKADRDARQEIADRRAKRLERSVYEKAAAAAQPKEEPAMPDPSNKFYGITKAIAKVMSERPDTPLHVNDVVALLQKEPGFEGVDYTIVGGNLGNLAKSKTRKYPIERVVKKAGHKRSGVYKWATAKPEPVANAVEQGITQFAEKAADIAPNVSASQPTNQIVSVKAPSLNGNSPDLLSKVHVLQGGRYLYEGDDGQLYLIGGIVPLNV